MVKVRARGYFIAEAWNPRSATQEYQNPRANQTKKSKKPAPFKVTKDKSKKKGKKKPEKLSEISKKAAEKYERGYHRRVVAKKDYKELVKILGDEAQAHEQAQMQEQSRPPTPALSQTSALLSPVQAPQPLYGDSGRRHNSLIG